MAYTTINKSTEHFNTKLYTGNGSNSRAVTGVGFQPDWLWIKNRDNSTPYSHQTFDRVRGATAGALYVDLTNTEDSSYPITSFDTDGFTLRATSHDSQNGNGNALVSWNWKAGNSAGSSNSDGSITSTVSANTTSGFSIVKYTGTGSNATVGHGLGTAPAFYIVKGINKVHDWRIFHQSLGATKSMELNERNAANTASGNWNDTAPTNSVFSLGNFSAVNESGKNYIAYCFAEKTGYSKFGSYTGNANANGPFVYTGFKPAWVMWKKTDTEDWGVSDNTRDTFNVMNLKLRPNSSSIESTANAHMDFLSNGFKWRSSSGEFNGSGGTYLYHAFGQSLVGSNNVPCTAR